MRQTKTFSLFSKARTEIFRMLFLPSSKETYLREMERKAGVTLRALQVELEGLRVEDLILIRKDGNRLYYRANREHPLFSEIQGITLKSFGLKDVLYDALSKVKGIDFAFVFGSFAKGEETANSDVDLMVIGDISTRQLLPALKKPGQLLDREINPHVIIQSEWIGKKTKKNTFVLNILKGEKIFIIGDEHEFKRLGK